MKYNPYWHEPKTVKEPDLIIEPEHPKSAWEVRLHPTYNTYSIFEKVGGKENKWAGFGVHRSAFCCAVEEIGTLTWSEYGLMGAPLSIPTELGREAVKKYLDSRRGKEGTPGLALIHFAKPRGSGKPTAWQWIELFQEVGFQQLVPDFENPVHPGNMITQLVYAHRKP